MSIVLLILVMNFSDFSSSLSRTTPPQDLPVHLIALWYDGKGDWQQAHALVDQLKDQASALVHAYLHRKEGDTWNADYWYNKAGAIRPNLSLEEEWEQLVLRFL